MTTKGYRLRIVEGTQEFEVEGDKAFVLEMLKRFGPGVTSTTGTLLSREKGKGRQTANRDEPSGKAISIREFIQQLDLKKHTDISLAFGYYLEKHAGMAHFTPADINTCYYEAKLETSNTSQMIIQNIRGGRMMQSKKTKGEKGKSRYTLTHSGEEFITARLQRSR